MDNASKALIMAGAILIAVMLISLGVLLYNRAADVANDATDTIGNIGAQVFNEQFTQFCGPTVSASTVKTLINKVNSTTGSNHPVTLRTGSKYISNLRSVETGTGISYLVEATNFDNNGYLALMAKI